MSADGEVTIAGRTFRLGAVYAPRPGSYGRRSKPRRLLDYTADSLLPGGRVTVASMPSGREHALGPRACHGRGGVGGLGGRGGMPRGGYRRRHQPDRYEVHKAKMRGRVIVMALAIGALAAVLVAGLTMLAKSP